MPKAEQRLARVGARIRALRKQRSMSRDALAHEAGVSESSIARLERGEEVRASTYLAVIDYLERCGDLLGISERIARLSEVGRARVLELIRFEEKQ